VGEWAATTIARGRSDSEQPLKRLLQIDYPNSLGLMYSTFTAFLGFAPSDAECSTMALASFGEPSFEEAVRRIITVEDDGTYRVDPAYFCFEALDRQPFTARFVELFGTPRAADSPLRFDSTGERTDRVTPDEQRYADVAASVQRVLEDILVRLARTARRLTGLDALCIAGGVAMNCVAMTRVATQAGFTKVFIPPDPGDGGAAAVAALLHSARSSYRVSPYLGAEYPIAPAAAMMEALDWDHLASYRSATASPYGGVRVTALAGDAITVRTVDALQNGKIVGWFRGRSETGPRALGNRSILCAPGRLDVVRRLSARVKRRAAFRPYALAIADASLEHVLGDTHERDLGAWMQRSYAVRSEALDEVRGAVHIDGTTRAQICDAAANPPFHRLLQTFGEASGTAALLNTSFNEAGSPLVETPEEALIMFLRSDMDCLALEDVFLEKTA
jgi:carbamoyltransferase